jgi:HK97 family phage portal protein
MGLMNWIFGTKAARQIVGSTVMKFGLPVYDRYNQQLNVDRYATLDDVYSITRLIAKTAAQIPLIVYKVKSQSKLKAYQAASKGYDSSPQSFLRLKQLKEQALEEVPDADPLKYLLDNPNPLYSRTEYLEGFYTMRLICGNSYVYKPTLDFGVNAGKPAELWLMPTQFTNPVVTQTFPKEVLGYQLRLFGIVDVPKEDVAHSRYFNPQFTIMGDELIGLSPLQALHRNIQKSKSENDFQVAGFQNSGAQGILSFEEGESLTPEAIGKMKKDYYAESSDTINARKVLWNNNKVTFTQMGLGPVDMQVIDSMKATFKKFCNAYAISDRLFNNDATGSEISDKGARRGLYINAAIPEVYAYRDLVNKDIAPAFGAEYYIDCDITEITELQADMKTLADSLAVMWWVTPNEKREVQNFDISSDPNMDKIMVPSGMQFIDDLQLPVDLNNPANDYGATA